MLVAFLSVQRVHKHSSGSAVYHRLFISHTLWKHNKKGIIVKNKCVLLLLVQYFFVYTEKSRDKVLVAFIRTLLSPQTLDCWCRGTDYPGEQHIGNLRHTVSPSNPSRVTKLCLCLACACSICHTNPLMLFLWLLWSQPVLSLLRHSHFKVFVKRSTKMGLWMSRAIHFL